MYDRLMDCLLSTNSVLHARCIAMAQADVNVDTVDRQITRRCDWDKWNVSQTEAHSVLKSGLTNINS